MGQNSATNEQGKQAPARLTRPYWSTYQHIPSGKVYLQMDKPGGNNWQEVVSQGAGNPEIRSIKIKIPKGQYETLYQNPIAITPAILGLNNGETANILQSKTVWRLEPDGTAF